MTTVFISYRRETAAGEARALFNALASRLGEKSVFMDVDSISLGRDFRRELEKRLSSCDLMLVLIDRDWATLKDGTGRNRLATADDYVRVEVEGGLRRDIAVIPILVRGAQMPAAEDLPPEIRDLAYRNGFELSHNRWESDVREIIRRLGLERPRIPAARFSLLLSGLAVLAYLILAILQSQGFVGAATGASETAFGHILTSLLGSLFIIGVLLNFILAYRDALMISLVAVLAYMVLDILQALGMVGAATGATETTFGRVLAMLIIALFIVGVLLKFVQISRSGDARRL
jgi:hypothetical protein